MRHLPPQNEASDSLAEFFCEPISVYTDAQAREDGFLAVPGPGGVNRVTRAVFDHSPFVREKRVIGNGPEHPGTSAIPVEPPANPKATWPASSLPKK